MVIVDTTVWIDYLRGDSRDAVAWLDREIDSQRIGLTDVNLCEVLQGVRSQRAFLEVRRELMKFEIFPTGGVELAVAAANNYRALRAKGYTVRKTIDCWIASFCLLRRHALLHNDRDFDPFEEILGLLVVHP